MPELGRYAKKPKQGPNSKNGYRRNCRPVNNNGTSLFGDWGPIRGPNSSGISGKVIDVMKLTLAQAKQLAKDLGFKLTKTDSEYRLLPPDCTEDSAYYSDDLNDILETMKVWA